MTTPVIDTRTYRTELEQPSACGGRWGLYVDGRLIARSPEPMGDAAARDWANSQPWGAAPHPGAPPAGGGGAPGRGPTAAHAPGGKPHRGQGRKR